MDGTRRVLKHLLLLVFGALWLQSHAPLAVAAANKWTIFVYMLADNDLEQFGLMDMEEIMAGMAAEPPNCQYSACGAACPDGTAPTYSAPCTSGSAASTMSRCCAPESYPDVLLLVDRGNGNLLDTNIPSTSNIAYADYSYVRSSWTTTKELLALPGGQWDQLKDHSELDMASPAVLADFLRRGLVRFPPEADDSRKYMLVFWDHGSGWWGYGVDHTCGAVDKYNENWGCDMLTMQTLAQGLSDGLMHPVTGAPVMLDIIGFDACLMAMYEVASLLAPYSRNLLVSELLEPGHGWDYEAPLRGITQRVNAAGQAVTSLSAKDVGDLVIQGYLQQAADYRTTGLTLALLDLTVVDGTLLTSMNSMMQYMSKQLNTTPAYAMAVLRQRASLGVISGAEENIDLGALLTSFKNLGMSFGTRLADTTVAYNSAVRSFARDAELDDGTGMAIYFPSASSSLSNRYAGIISQDPPALSSWMTFLDTLYKATDLVTLEQQTGGFKFVEAYAIPYLAVSTRTWITHGTLSSSMGLTSNLMYGFRTPSHTEFITAGSIEASISAEKSAVGAWSGYLFGLVQDIDKSDGAFEGLALAYADEQRIVDTSTNRVKQLILQVKVFYASSCYASMSNMKKGLIKYVYDTDTTSSTMQLFVSSSGGSWGEVPPAQGGVVIPYLGSYNLAANATGSRVGVSFGYADCLKWGYDSSIELAAFDAVQAADILGLDLTRDMETQLLVTSFDGAVTAIAGYFMPAQKTLAGCQCSQRWPYHDSPTSQQWISGTCINPNGAERAWCIYEPDSCTNATAAADSTWDYCAATTTLSGCKCHHSWVFKNQTYYGSAINDGDPRGSWCVVDRATCPGNYRAHQYGASQTINATINGATNVLTGLDFDYTQVTTLNGCHCRNTWDYGGVTYSGTCRQGLENGKHLPGFSAETSWCYIDSGCIGSGHLNGYKFDICTSEGGRVTEAGTACQLPAVYNGVPMYDCISYNHTSGSSTSKPWCFTNATAGSTGSCAPWSCSAALKQYCPAANVTAAVADLASWASPICLETLCNARQALTNISQCAQDTQGDKLLLQQTYGFLSSSQAFNELLGNTTSQASLTAYCNANYGQLCVDHVVDPVCPALFRSDNQWFLSRDPSLACNMDCLTTLCRLQEQAKAKVKGTPSWQSAVATSRGYTVPILSCSDSSLENLVRWTMMQDMDNLCGWPGPTTLACNRLLSPPQLCAVETVFTGASGNITDNVPEGGFYSASSSCAWTINSPDRPYITLNFSTFNTEDLYDVVTVEDFDGVIGMFSGTDVPSLVTTDTGILKLQFTADGSVQGHGFSASYVASATPQVKLPTCTGDAKLLQVVLRSRQYASELSWLITARSTFADYLSALNAPSQLNIVMAGGLLPSLLRSKVPKAVADVADEEYKDYRSYYSYACVPVGNYNLNLYDSYGDGWDGGRITLTQVVVNASAGCQLLSETTTGDNRTVAFTIMKDADTNIDTCSSMTFNADSAPYYVEAGIIVKGEDTSTFNLAKQRKIKEGLALIMDVDSGQVTFHGQSNATTADLQDVVWSNKSNTASSNSNGSGSIDSSSSVKPLGRVVLEAAGEAAAASDQRSRQDEGDDFNTQSMQQVKQAWLEAMDDSTIASRRALLGRLAVPVSDLVAAGVFDNTHRQLQLAGEQLMQYESAGGTSAAVEGPVEGPACIVQGTCETSKAAGATDCAAAGTDSAAAVTAPDRFADTRKLQQLLTLDPDGNWQKQTGNDGATPAPPTAATTGATVTGAIIPANSSHVADVLAAQPLADLADAGSGINGSQTGSHQPLVALLKPLKPVIGPKPKNSNKTRNSRGQNVVVIYSSFRDAFDAAGRSAFSSGSGGGRLDGETVMVAAVEKPGKSSLTADEQVVAAAEYHEPQDSQQPQPAASPQPSDNSLPASSSSDSLDSGYTVLDAVRPSRMLIETEGTAASAAHPEAPGLASKHRQRQHQRPHLQEAAGATVVAIEAAAGTLDAKAAAEFAREGRFRPDYTRPRPRPVRPLAQAQDNKEAISTLLQKQGSEQVRAAATVNGSIATTAAAAAVATEAGRQTLNLMGPKKPIKRKQQQQFGPTDVHAVPQHLRSSRRPSPTATSAAAAVGTGAAGAQDSYSVRQLQATSDSTGLLLITRISGYKTSAAATDAAAALKTLISNGTLRNTLVSQGWSNIDVGIAYSIVGVRQGKGNNGSLLRIIIPAAAGAGGILLLAIGIFMWARRSRHRGAAQVPTVSSASSPNMASSFTAAAMSGQPHTYSGGSHPRHSCPPMQGGYLLGPSAQPVPNYPPQGYSAPTMAAAAARARSNSSPMSTLAAELYAPRSPTNVVVNANPFAAAGGGAGGTMGQQQQQQQYYGAPSSPRAQPWVGGTETGGRTSPYMQQQQPSYIQTSQTAVEPFNPGRQSAAFISYQQQGGMRSGSPQLL